MVFNPQDAEQLKAGTQISIDGAPGLRLIARKARKTWTYRFKNPVDGRIFQLAIGQWPAMSYADAWSQWDDLRQKCEAGLDLVKVSKPAPSRGSKNCVREQEEYLVSHLLEEYLDGHIRRHRKPKGVAEMERLLSSKYTDSIRSMSPSAVKRTHAVKLIETLGARAPVLAKNLRTELGAAWSYAMDGGRLSGETPNWWKQILRGKLRSRGPIIGGLHQSRKDRVLDLQEVAALIRFLPNFSQTVDDLLTLYLWTGARGRDIVQMEAEEISEEADGWWWTVPVYKLGTSRHAVPQDFRVPLVGRALTVVCRRLSKFQSGYLFKPKNPSARSPHIEQKILGTATYWVRPDTTNSRGMAGRNEKLHIKCWSPQDLRRTVRSTLKSLGCPDEVSSEVLGENPSRIAEYSQSYTTEKEKRYWLTLLSKHWECQTAS